MRRSQGRVQVVVNPIACEGRGLCAELLPEMISLDEWGYPIVDPSPVPYHLEPHLRRAISACPTLALMTRPVEAQDGAAQPGARPPRQKRSG